MVKRRNCATMALFLEVRCHDTASQNEAPAAIPDDHPKALRAHSLAGLVDQRLIEAGAAPLLAPEGNRVPAALPEGEETPAALLSRNRREMDKQKKKWRAVNRARRAAGEDEIPFVFVPPQPRQQQAPAANGAAPPPPPPPPA